MKTSKPPFWRDVRILRIGGQIGALVVGGVILRWLIGNLLTNLSDIGIEPDFTKFLKSPTSFQIRDSGFDPKSPVWKMFIVGVQNTFAASIVGISLAFILGLMIGIAGLGVTLVRAVRERRREIGMLRSMGFPRSGVRRMFLFEALFVAVSGVLVGVGLGALTAYQVITHSSAFSRQLPFVMPTVPLLGIVVFTVAGAAIAQGHARVTMTVTTSLVQHLVSDFIEADLACQQRQRFGHGRALLRRQ